MRHCTKLPLIRFFNCLLLQSEIEQFLKLCEYVFVAVMEDGNENAYFEAMIDVDDQDAKKYKSCYKTHYEMKSQTP